MVIVDDKTCTALLFKKSSLTSNEEYISDPHEDI